MLSVDTWNGQPWGSCAWINPLIFAGPCEKGAIVIPPAVGKLRHRALEVTCHPCHGVFCLPPAPLLRAVKMKVWLPSLLLFFSWQTPRRALSLRAVLSLSRIAAAPQAGSPLGTGSGRHLSPCTTNMIPTLLGTETSTPLDTVPGVRLTHLMALAGYRVECCARTWGHNERERQAHFPERTVSGTNQHPAAGLGAPKVRGVRVGLSQAVTFKTRPKGRARAGQSRGQRAFQAGEWHDGGSPGRSPLPHQLSAASTGPCPPGPPSVSSHVPAENFQFRRFPSSVPPPFPVPCCPACCGLGVGQGTQK